MNRELRTFDFASLEVPSSPNWHLACPPNSSQAHCRDIAPIFDVELSVLRAVFFEIVSAAPRAALIADAPDVNRYRFIQKSRVFKFVDEITVEFVELDTRRSSLHIFSRSRSGWWDLGVNRRRVRQWLKQVQKNLALQKA
ncbi:MAG TPA: DUF1499 domain-containing protein [Kiloniellales bacterium]|jgi:uncharacterized protein (DUF1499 family)|nr:DUF1499 domain-containing protein [Kiloniellales bacterium]